MLAEPSQRPGARERHGLTRAQTDRELWAVDGSGRRFSGAEAVNQVLLALGPPWSWIAIAARAVLPVERGAYRLVARNRGRLSRHFGVEPDCARPGACE